MASIYAKKDGGGRRGSIYAGGSSSGGDDRGLLETLPGSKIAADTFKNLKDVAVNLPAGLLETGRALGYDTRDLVLEGDVTPERSAELGKQSVLSMLEDLRHPLRNPGYTLLDLLALGSLGAGTAARAAAGARALRTGGSVWRSTLTRPKPGPRTLRVGDLEVQGRYSRSALARGAQRVSDARLQRAEPGSRREQALLGRANKWLEQNRRVEESRARSAANRLAAIGRKLKPEEQMALRLVAEEAPVGRRIAARELNLAKAKDDATRGRLQERIDLMRGARELLDEQDGKPVFKPGATKLRRVYAELGKVAKGREEMLAAVGRLTPEAAQESKTKAGRIALGAEYERVPAQAARVEHVREYPARTTTIERPRTPEEGTTRLAELDKTFGKFLDDAVDTLIFKGDRQARIAYVRSAQGSRNKQSGSLRGTGKTRAGKARGSIYKPPPKQKHRDELAASGGRLVKDDLREQAGEMIRKVAERNPDHPVVAKYLGLVAERDRLRAALDDPDVVFGGKAAELGTVTETITGEPTRRPRRRAHYRVKDSSTEQTLARVREDAGRAKPTFDRALVEAAREAGATPKRSVLKSEARSLEKIMSDYDGDSLRLLDTVRGTIIVDSVAQAEAAIRALGDRVTILRGKDRVDRPEFGYRDYMLNVEIDGHVAEVQILPREMAAVKRRGHDLYEQQRTLPEGDPRKAELQGRMLELYEGAWARFERRSAAAARSASKSAREMPGYVRTYQPESLPEGRGSGSQIVAGPPRGIETATSSASKSRSPSAGLLSKLGIPTERSVSQRASLRDTPGSEFEASPEAVFVGNPVERSRLTGRPKVGTAGTIGHPRNPGSLKRATGAAVRSGRERLDTTRIVAERNLEGVRLTSILRLRDQLARAGRPVPARPDDVAMRLDLLPSSQRLPAAVRQFLDNPDSLADMTPEEAGSIVDRLRDTLFKTQDELRLDPQAAAEFDVLAANGELVWVPKRLLGNLARRDPNLGDLIGGRATRFVDAVNNAQKLAAIYLKPGYVAPQLLGNLFFNLTQQGWAAPRNLTWAVRLNRKLGEADTAVIDDLMGEGAIRMLSGEGQTRLSRATTLTAGTLSRVVDTPFRRASFLHEARQAGYRTPEQIRRLVNDPELADELMDVVVRANQEIVDFGEMSPLERSLIRRVVFVYPWVKGSTMYAGRFLRDKPVQAAVYAQVAERGQERAEEELGPVPSYLQGSFPVGGRIVNPASFSPFGTPAQVGQIAAGMVTGEGGRVADATSVLSPASSFVTGLVTRRNSFGRPIGDLPTFARDEFVEGLPQTNLVRALTGTSRSTLYNDSPVDALMRYLIGGFYPRRYNRDSLNERAAREKSGY